MISLTAGDPAMPGKVARVRAVAPPDRRGGGGLSLRTLAIASAGSLSAAMVTSRLFPPGTIYASALTPVIVAAVSEMLNRPADRVAELTRQRRTLVSEARRAETARVLGDEPSVLSGAPEFARGAEDIEPPHSNGTGERPPVRIYGSTRARARRILHPKVWLVTGLVAFVIAAALVTLPELIFGGAAASNQRTTFFGGGTTHTSTHTTTTTTTTTETKTAPKTVTETVPAQTPSSTETQTQPTTTDTSTQTTPAPTGGAPVPTDTTTSTTTTPPSSGTQPPTP
jgi:hypothetical protein